MLALLALLTLDSPRPLTLAGIQAGQTVQAIEQRLKRAGWVSGASAFAGRYQGLRAVLSPQCGTARCRPQAVPQTLTLTLYGPTCQEGRAAIIRENGRPDDARLKLSGGPDESLWNRRNVSLTAYCADGVMFARLRRNVLSR